MTQQIDTGHLRSLLQPVVFARLTEDQLPLKAGNVVALQYWGNGKVAITRVADGARVTNVAHTIKAETLNHMPELYGPNLGKELRLA